MKFELEVSSPWKAIKPGYSEPSPGDVVICMDFGESEARGVFRLISARRRWPNYCMELIEVATGLTRTDCIGCCRWFYCTIGEFVDISEATPVIPSKAEKAPPQFDLRTALELSGGASLSCLSDEDWEDFNKAISRR